MSLQSALPTAPATAAEPQRIYLGTYTGQGDADAKGIYMTELNVEDGSLAPPRLVVECASPAFLAKYPGKPFLYAVGEIWGGSGNAPVYAFQTDEKTGELTKLNEQTVPGKGACHLCVCVREPGSSDACVAVACYGSGTVHVLPIKADGSLGECSSNVDHGPVEMVPGKHPTRQKQAHAHAVYYLTRPKLEGTLLAVDLGVDKIFRYNLGSDNQLHDGNPAYELPPGSGPRHLAYQRTGPFFNIYILNELQSTVCVVRGGKILQTISTLPDGVKPEDCGNTTAAIFLHKTGRFLYASNRGHDSIALFAVDTEADPKTGNPNGLLTFIDAFPCGGKVPRSFDLSPCGRWLIVANQDGNNVRTFRIDPESGRLTPTSTEINLGKPVCVLPVSE